MPEEDSALLQAREDLKRQLAADEYQTLVDAVLAGIGRLIQKTIRRSSPTPGWFSVIILIAVVYALGFGLIFIAGDLPRFYKIVSEIYGPNGVLVMWLTSFLPIISLLLINDYIHRILNLGRTIVLDATESVITVADFRQWLGRACNQRLHLLVAIGSGIAIDAYVMSAPIPLLGQVGYGVAVFMMLISMFGAAYLYLVFGAVDLSLRLRRYELKLFAADPSASEVITRLSSLLSLGVYLVALYAAAISFIAVAGGLLPTLGLGLVVLWLPIIAMFVLNQTSLASIIRRVRWRTLNGIQMQVEALQAAENYSSKETLDAVNRLLDYHDRIKATHSSALDLRATLNFLNSLLLPLLGFLLANLDHIAGWFRPAP